MHPAWWGTAFEHVAAITPARVAVVRWSGGDDAVVEWVNPSAAALLAAAPEDIAGRQLSEVYPARYLPEIVEQLRTARDQGSYAYEVVRELPEGRVTLEAVNVAIGDDRYVSFAIDRTAEREAERRLRQVTELTGAGLYHWNVPADESSWTDELFEVLGHEPGAFVPTIDRYIEHIHPDDRPQALSEVSQIRASGDTITHSRHRIVRPDGQVRTVDVRAQQVRDADGRSLYVLGVVRDVTDEVEFERHAALARRAEQQQATALTVHDKVVQALATVLLALDLGEVDTARTEALAAVDAAQTVVADLLGEIASVQGAVEPGTLRTPPPEAS